jgi:transcriptional regulator with XRE-family HTH domain
MKTVERTEARRLRIEDGVSVREISRRLGVSKGSVSRWVQDIELTEEQRGRLFRSAGDSRLVNWTAMKRASECRHKEWQNTGREDAKKKNCLHIAGCMLYWAEGHKRNNKYAVRFSNSELPMLKLFLCFLRDCFGIDDNKIVLALNCYTDVKSLKEIEEFWLKGLDLPRTCLRKSTVDRRPCGTQNKMGSILPYGTCRMMVYDVSVIQRIYGAIQEYGGFDKSQW